MKGSCIHPPPNPKERGLENAPRKSLRKKALKITKKHEREQHIQALRNHYESSIHHKEVHTRSSLPHNHPSLSQDLTMKLSS
jgi:polyribonucleotide nucleotidyltransferase